MNVIIEHALQEDAVMIDQDVMFFVVELHLPQSHPDELAVRHLAVLQHFHFRVCR